MKSLFYSAGSLLNEHLGILLDEAKAAFERGEDVLWISCDKSMQICFANLLGESARCNYCRLIDKLGRHELPSGITQTDISEYLTPEMIAIAEAERFSYDSVDDIKALKWKDVSIGYGAIATYVSATRNIYPLIDNKFRKLIDTLMRMEIKLAQAFSAVVGQYNPERVYVYNGRFAQTRPIVNITLARKIELYNIDVITPEKRFKFRKRLFINSMPHDINNNFAMMSSYWESSKETPEQREKTARAFFERRRTGNASRSFIGHQQKGLIPETWDDTKRNILICNSSEDEFFSIGPEWESGALFASQIEAIKKIAEHYITDNSKHFYLKIHPNLTGIKYKYHTDLYKLDYPNLSVIKADSAYSTYDMIDAADKVIVFNSTTGIESTYWGKPAIALRQTLYAPLGVVYRPQNEGELFDLIDRDNLVSLYNDKILLFGYYYNNTDYPQPELAVDIKEVKMLGRKFLISKYMTIAKSHHLYVIYTRLYSLFSKFFNRKRLFSESEFPINEA